jgi:hypothetical protein
MALPRISLLPHRSDWTEIERDAVNVIEHALAMRALDRPGDVLTTPWTIGYVQRWLRKTKARRRGRDYARDVLATLVDVFVLRKDPAEEDVPTVVFPAKDAET